MSIELQEIHAVMSFLLTRQPSNLHLIILSRHDPPLALGRLRAQGTMQELRSADLRFNLEETDAFFQAVMGATLSQDEVTALEARTEGWVAGLQLAGLALQGHQDTHEFIRRFAGDHTYIVDYLGDEIFNRQSAEICDFLLQTSVLDRFCASLCDVTSGNSNAQEMLAYLSSANLFLVPLDDKREWFRFHHLFRDLLQYRLKQVYPERILALHLRASNWYELHGFQEAALRHAVKAEELDRAADLIAPVALQMIASAQQVMLRRWIEQLPESFILARPDLCVYHAWALNFTHQIDAIEPRLQNAESALAASSQQTSSDILGQIAAIRAFNARRRSDLALSSELCQVALRLLPDDNLIARSIASVNLGINHYFTGNFLAAEEFLALARRLSLKSNSSYTMLVATGYLARVLLIEAKLEEASDLCRRTLDFDLPKGKHPILPSGYVHASLGSVLYEQNQLAAAEEAFGQAITFGNQMMDWTLEEYGLMGLAWLQQSRGNPDAANQLVQHAADYIAQQGATHKRLAASIARGSNMAGSGQSRQGNKLGRITTNSTDTTQSARRELSDLVYARVRIRQAYPNQALDVLEGLRQTANEAHAIGWLIECLILQALALDLQSDEDQALDALAHALSLAEPQGYIRTFVDEGIPLTDLLTLLLARYEEFNARYPFSANYVSHLISDIRAEKLPLVHVVNNLDKDGNPTAQPHSTGNYFWHTDKSYHAVPSLATLLHALELPPEGGDTLFANTYLAYETLTQDRKEQLADLRAIHSWEASRRNTGNMPATEQQKRERPPVSHPVVRTHPETGRKLLYIGIHTSHIEGMPKAEGKALLDELLEHASQPEHVYRHKWRQGDLCMWDNRCLLHRVDSNYDMSKHRRVLHRTVVRGTVPY